MDPSVQPNAEPAVREAQEKWLARFEERRQALFRGLGARVEDATLHKFAWKDHALPGACAYTVPLSPPLVVTLGLSQPEKGPPWEFAVRVAEPSDWAPDLLYQLLTLWLRSDWTPEPGAELPLLFFRDPLGRAWAGLTDDAADIDRVGTLDAAVLWPSGGLLSVVGATRDERDFGRETSTAHLVLLLARRGVRTLDPFRPSVLSTDDGRAEADRVRGLSREQAVAEIA